jgi:ABC-type multidrug transport system ATPase subunit
MFDRIMFLSDGYLIYNGKPQDCMAYFTLFGVKMDRFKNPADKLAQLGVECKHLIFEHKNFFDLVDFCKTQ